MSGFSDISIKCTRCGVSSKAKAYNSINVKENPELKASVMNGSIFVHQCPHCGASNLICSPMAYIDPVEKFIILYATDDVAIEAPEDGAFAGFTVRHVREIGSLIEKVKIFDAGLDDRVMELCKNVTVMELGKEVPLKFLNMNGPDNEIVLTYPDKDHMEMIAIGFNVYEDCRGILERNQ